MIPHKMTESKRLTPVERFGPKLSLSTKVPLNTKKETTRNIPICFSNVYNSILTDIRR